MERLDALWKNPDGNLPFATRVNEALVLDAITEIHTKGCFGTQLQQRVRQWMRFNRWLNADTKDEPYQTWVEEVYRKIDTLLDTPDPHTLANATQGDFHPL